MIALMALVIACVTCGNPETEPNQPSSRLSNQPEVHPALVGRTTDINSLIGLWEVPNHGSTLELRADATTEFFSDGTVSYLHGTWAINTSDVVDRLILRTKIRTFDNAWDFSLEDGILRLEGWNNQGTQIITRSLLLGLNKNEQKSPAKGLFVYKHTDRSFGSENVY